MDLSQITNFLGVSTPIFRMILIVIILLILFNFFLRKIKIKLLKRSKSKKQITNIKILTKIIGVIFTSTVLLIAFFSYFGSWSQLGLLAGLITAGLGFALQRPITGLAAWIMIVIKRPFQIGDRIAIGKVQGDVYDITLTHVYIDEVGGLIESDLPSGRNIMVPNYLLFEENIINYTLLHDYILGQVLIDVTYESDLKKAVKIAEIATLKHLNEGAKSGKFSPRIRIAMSPSSMTLKILFYSPIKEINETSSEIIREFYNLSLKEKNVELAYPHTEIVFKDKKIFKKSK